jgi:hypothetical protein
VHPFACSICILHTCGDSGITVENGLVPPASTIKDKVTSRLARVCASVGSYQECITRVVSGMPSPQKRRSNGTKAQSLNEGGHSVKRPAQSTISQEQSPSGDCQLSIVRTTHLFVPGDMASPKPMFCSALPCLALLLSSLPSLQPSFPSSHMLPLWPSHRTERAHAVRETKR